MPDQATRPGHPTRPPDHLADHLTDHSTRSPDRPLHPITWPTTPPDHLTDHSTRYFTPLAALVKADPVKADPAQLARLAALGMDLPNSSDGSS